MMVAAVASVATVKLDGQSVIISGSADRTVRIWDMDTGTKSAIPLPVTAAR